MRALAEDPSANTPVPRGFERVENDRYCVFLGPWPSFTSVQRLRLRDDEVDETVDEIRGLIRDRGHRKPVWWLGESARPRGLAERLVGLGLERGKPPDQEPTVLAMALLAEPPPGPADVEARLVESLEEYIAASELQWEAFRTPEPEREEQRARLQARWKLQQRPEAAKTFVAYVGGRLAGVAVAVFAQH